MDDETNGRPDSAEERCPWLLPDRQEAFDRAFFADVLRHGGDNPDVLRRQAENLAFDGDHVGALALDRRLADRYPDDPSVQYNLACSLSMTGHVADALQALARAIELGYADFAHIEVDPDLDPLREEPRYHELLRQRLGE